MKLGQYALICALIVAICLGLLASHYHSKYSVAQESIESTRAVTKNVLAAINLMQYIAKAAHDEKTKTALESQRAKADIKTATAGDVCATGSVPAGAVNRLREYADTVRNSTSNPDPQRLNR